MEDNYWNYNRLIGATEEEIEALLKYEIWMFYETCNQLNSCQATRFERNLLLESLSTHTRILIDFFYGKKKYQNDLIAQDLLSDNINWQKERPSVTEVLKVAKNKADKQLAHLGRWRVKIERDNKKVWNWNDIKKDMEIIIEKFGRLRNNQNLV